jgi:hypothetical protein
MDTAIIVALIAAVAGLLTSMGAAGQQRESAVSWRSGSVNPRVSWRSGRMRQSAS